MVCKNCNTELTDTNDYCSSCGGKVIRNRLTIKALFSHFSEEFLNYDNRFFQTFINLFKNPEDVIGGYINGTRKKYINPVAFFGISLTISGIYILILKKFFIQYLDFSKLYDDNELSQKIVDNISGPILEYNSIFYFILIPILALISLLVFYNKKYNYTEHFVIYLYSMSLVSILSSVLSILVFLTVPDIFLTFAMSINFLNIIFHTYILKRIFNLSFGQIILKLIFFGVIFIVVYIASSILIFVILAMTGVINLQDFVPPS